MKKITGVEMYLGQEIAYKQSQQEEIEQKITRTSNIWSLKFILKDPFSLPSKSEGFNIWFLPTLTCGICPKKWNRKSEPHKIQ